MRTLLIGLVLFVAYIAPSQASLITVEEQVETTFSNPVFTFTAFNLPSQSQGVGFGWGLSKQASWQWSWQKQKQQAAPVPTPGAIALMMAGLLGIAAFRSRRFATALS